MSKPTVARKSSTASLGQWHALLENITPVTEREMTDAEMKERERLVKGMKKSAGDFEKRYPGRGKDVMYATATKRAMGEDQKPYPWECMNCGNKWRSTESGQVNPVRCPKCGASGEDDILPGVFSGPGSQSGGNLNKAPETFTVMAIDDTNPEYKRVGSNYKPNVKVLDQMHSLEKSDVMHAAKMFRQKHPKATISVENKGGKIVKVFKPGEMIKEADMPVMSAGARVMVPHKGKKVAGKVVRYDKGDMHGSPFYIIDVGEYASIKVPAHEVMQESEHDDDTVHVDLQFDSDDVSPTDDQDMMLAQLDAIASRARKLHQTLGQADIHEVPAWIQDKVSIADHNMSAILDYYMFETTTLTEAEKTASGGEVVWFLQPAHVVAKMLNGADYVPVGVKAEDIVNNAVLEFLKSSHTTETWKAAGAALTAVRDVAGVNWDMSLVKPALQQAMGIQAKAVKPAPEPEAEPAPKEEPKAKAKEAPKAVAPEKKEGPKPEAAVAPEKAPEKKEKTAEPSTTTEEVEIEIKLGKPMDKVTFQQKRQAALDFAAATCPGMNPNGVTPEQIINNAVSVWFHRHPVPLDAELEVLGNALDLLSKLGIDWDFHLVPGMYLQALKLPNVKVTEVDEKDTSAAGKKVEKLEDILIEL